MALEDYQLACLQRAEDTALLDAAKHTSGSMHLAGAAVECLLKALVVQKYGITEWKHNNNNPGHSIRRPGHSFQEAIRLLPALQSYLTAHPQHQQWFDDVLIPGGYKLFIDMRYESDVPYDTVYQQWLGTYKKLLAWLLKEGPNFLV